MVEYPIVVYDAPVWTVYMHVNKINGKKYVGITKQQTYYRWCNGYGYKPKNGNKTLFYNDILKYGWDNFDHYILLDNIPVALAKIMEIVLIHYYNTHVSNNNGYNISLYMYGQYKGSHNNNERKVVALNTGKIYNSITEAANDFHVSGSNITAACKGRQKHCCIDSNGNPIAWAYYDDYINMSIEEINARINSKKEYKTKKPVICLNTDKIWESIHDAARYYEISAEGISNCCNAHTNPNYKNHEYCGYDKKINEWLKWMFLDDYLKLSDEYKLELKNYQFRKTKHHMSKEIICLNTLEILHSASDITKYTTSKSSRDISRACSKPSRSYGKNLTTNESLHWMYYTDYKLLANEEKEELKQKYYTGNLLRQPESQDKEVYNEDK